MARSLLKPFFVAVFSGALGCGLYAPTVLDCSITCADAGAACPQGTTCTDGYCRLAGVSGACTCKTGDTRPCGGGKGVCTPGVQQCNADGTWGSVCVGEVKPSVEVCDGKDNDCNGQVDDAVPDAPACALSQGVCAGSKQSCVDSAWQPCPDSAYGPHYEAVEVSCDGLDNDCDGLADLGPARQLTNDVLNDWHLLGYDGGFALVSTRGTGGTNEELVVLRFDGQLTPLSAQSVGQFPAPIFSAANQGSDVYVAWSTDGGLAAARVPFAGAAVPLAPVGVTPNVSDRVRVGVSEEVVVAFAADHETTVRVARWGLDGAWRGAADVRPLGQPFDLFYGLTMSATGHHLLIHADSLDDAGYSNEFTRVVRLADGGMGDSAIYRVDTAFVLEHASGLVSGVYGYSGYVDSAEQSGAWWVPDLFDPLADEVTVESMTDNGTWSQRTGATLTNAGQIAVAMLNNREQQLWLGGSYTFGGDAGTTSFHALALGTDAGFGDPALVTAGAASMLGLGWGSLPVISARRVCVP
jgi:hypothetical protein